MFVTIFHHSFQHRPSQWKNFFIRRKEESDREGNNPSLTMEEDK